MNIQLTDQQLANAIIQWDTKTSSDRNRWSRDRVGLAIRQTVGEHWKALPRGNPSKGARLRGHKQSGQTEQTEQW